jgi:hypothetical protein
MTESHGANSLWGFVRATATTMENVQIISCVSSAMVIHRSRGVQVLEKETEITASKRTLQTTKIRTILPAIAPNSSSWAMKTMIFSLLVVVRGTVTAITTVLVHSSVSSGIDLSRFRGVQVREKEAGTTVLIRTTTTTTTATTIMIMIVITATGVVTFRSGSMASGGASAALTVSWNFPTHPATGKNADGSSRHAMLRPVIVRNWTAPNGLIGRMTAGAMATGN